MILVRDVSLLRLLDRGVSHARPSSRRCTYVPSPRGVWFMAFHICDLSLRRFRLQATGFLMYL